MTTAAFDAALADARPRIGIYFRLMISPVARLWLGIGDCLAGIDATDGVDGSVYRGLGAVLDVPAFQQMVNGAADRIEFKLSGVSQRVRDMAASESETVKGVALNIGIGVFDKDWQQIDDPTWIKRLEVDYLSLAGDAGMRSVSISARTIFTGRRRPGLSYFTDREQQTRSAGDLFCARTALYSADYGKTWPQF
jgi:hypothetical protein